MSRERSVRRTNAGPLALQMGDVTGAVDDLVHGYEQLVHTLPDLTEKIIDVYADTEQMAKQLEHRTRSMVDGYEYLQGLSTQLPEMFRETAEQHRKTLQGAISSLSPDELASIAQTGEILEKAKLNLHSITHERIVADVLTRTLIRETARHADAAKQATNKEQQDRYTRALTQTSNKVPVNNTTANRVFNSNVTRAESPHPTRRPTHTTHPTHPVHPTHTTHPTHNHHITTSTTADHTVVVTNNRNASIGDIYVSYKDSADQLSTPIYIPPYDPNRPRPAPAAQRPSHEHELGGYLNFNQHTPSAHYFGAEVVQGGVERVVARAVGDARMVPNMRRGSLPPELANLHTDPTVAITAADHLQTTRKKIVKRSVQFVEKETIARSLVGRLKQTDEEVADIKKKLAAAHNKFGKDQSAAMAKLQAIILELKEGMSGRDEALLKAVEALLREYMAKHKARPAENHDTAILKALEALLTPPPPVIDRLHEYKVLTVRPKVPVPVRTVPVVVPVAAPERVEREVEVQTDPVVAPVPVPVVAPVVPPVPVEVPVVPVVPPVVQVPVAQPQQIVVNVPVQNTVERELIELMHNVVTTQHATMQGNQALILSLIHERQPQTIIQEVVTEVPIPEPTLPTPTPLPTPAAPPLPTLPRYSTAFGEVVLGAQILTDVYTTPPTLIPSDHKPCVLRGIPPPEVRPVLPPRRVAERQDVLQDGDFVAAHEAQLGGQDIPIGGGSVDNNVDTTSGSDGASGGGGGNSGSDVTNEAATLVVDTDSTNPTTGIAITDPATNTTTDPTANTTEHTIPTMNSNLGLTLSGTSSTSGRGGSTMHTTPGTELHMPHYKIPPYMRRKASEFTIRAIMGTTTASITTGGASNGTSNGISNGSGVSGVSGVSGDMIGVNSNTTMYKNSTGFNAAADSRAANVPITTTTNTNADNTTTNVDQATLNFLRNLQVLSAAPINTTNTPHTNTTTNTTMALTPETLRQHISEGVQRGVSEALGLMDTHNRHRTYYNTNPSTNDTLHHSSSCDAYHTNRDSKHNYNANNTIHTPHTSDYDQRGVLSTHTNTNNIRHSLTLIKNKRNSKRGSGMNAGVRSTHCSNHPHYTNHTDSSNYNTNHIEHNHVANRDICQPPRRQAIAAQQRKTEHNTIMQDIMYSTTNAHNMCNEEDSIDDSVSLDETTAAYLRDPLMYNTNTDSECGNGNSVVSSLECDVVSGMGKGSVRLVQRDVHAQRHNELFSSTDNVPVKVHTTRTKHTNTANTNANTDTNTFVPLVSRVLQQSATEDVLYNQLTRQHNTNTATSTTSSIDNDRDQDDRMWDLTASAPMVTFKDTTNINTNINTHKHTTHTDVNASTSTTNTANPTPTKIAKYSTHTDGTIANMQLLRPTQYNQNEMRVGGDSDSFVSIGSDSEHSTSSRSILTHSTNSTDVSVNDSYVHQPIQYTDTNSNNRTTRTTNNTIPTTNTTNSYKRSSTTDINRANLAAPSMNTGVSNSVSSTSTGTSSDSGRRASLLPRYSPQKHKPTVSTHTHTNATTTSANTDNTELLAAQMMLNVLELHRPANYTTTPYLSNPITSHLKHNGYPTAARSKIYATESVDSASSVSVTERRYTNNRYFNTNHGNDVDSDLDCTGSSISSAPDELLDHGLDSNLNDYSDTRSKPKSGLTLMGIGSNKLLKVNRK